MTAAPQTSPGDQRVGARHRRPEQRSCRGRPGGPHPVDGHAVGQPGTSRRIAASLRLRRVRHWLGGTEPGPPGRGEQVHRGVPRPADRWRSVVRRRDRSGQEGPERRQYRAAAEPQGRREPTGALCRGNLGFLLRPVRAAALHVRGAAAGGGPDRSQLLRGPVPRAGHGPADPDPAPVQLCLIGIRAADVPPRRAAAQAAQPSQPLPARRAAPAPAGRGVGHVQRAPRDVPQPPGRPGTVGRAPADDLRPAHWRRAVARTGRNDLGPMAQGDRRGPLRGRAGRPGDRGVPDGRRGPVASLDHQVHGGRASIRRRCCGCR